MPRSSAWNKPRHVISLAASKTGYSILKNLSVLGPQNYSSMLKIFRADTKTNFSVLSYYLKPFRMYDIVSKNNKNYFLTKKGKKLLKIIDEYNEKFMTEDQDSICSNSDGKDYGHVMISICRNCSYVEGVKENE